MYQHTLMAGLAASAMLAGTSAEAATLVNFTFDDGTVFVNPADVAAHADITVLGPWLVRDGSLLGNGLKGEGDTGLAIGATSFGDGAEDGSPAGNAFGFQFQAKGVLNLTGFSFWEQGSGGGNGDGPSDWALSINGNELATGAATRGNPGGDHAAALSLTGLTGTVTVLLSASGAANDLTATWRVDNFILEGDVAPIPLPSTLPLLAGAGGLLALRRRRG